MNWHSRCINRTAFHFLKCFILRGFLNVHLLSILRKVYSGSNSINIYKLICKLSILTTPHFRLCRHTIVMLFCIYPILQLNFICSSLVKNWVLIRNLTLSFLHHGTIVTFRWNKTLVATNQVRCHKAKSHTPIILFLNKNSDVFVKSNFAGF